MSSVPTTRIRSRPRASGMLWIAALLVLGQLGASLHYVAIPHSTCAEHGEAVHDDSARLVHADHHAPRAASRSWSSDPTSPASEHEHDHCTFAVEVRSWLQRDALPRSVVAPAAVCLPALPVTALVAVRSVPVYLFAPKASPPV